MGHVEKRQHEGMFRLRWQGPVETTRICPSPLEHPTPGKRPWVARAAESLLGRLFLEHGYAHARAMSLETGWSKARMLAATGMKRGGRFGGANSQGGMRPDVGTSLRPASLGLILVPLKGW